MKDWRRRSFGEAPEDGFRLKVGLEPIDSELATNTGLLEATEWSEWLMLTAVHGYGARLETGSHGTGTFEVR